MYARIDVMRFWLIVEFYVLKWSVHATQIESFLVKTRMWANAQRDVRPAEYR